MKTLTSIFILFAAFQANALDTSGCSFNVTTQQTRTNAGFNLIIQNSMINEASCWNANDSAVIFSYEWLQNTPDTNHQVQFWVKVNGRESYLAGRVTCQQLRNLRYRTDSSDGLGIYKCLGTAQVLVGFQSLVSVEVAPQLNGSWDTRGFQQNYYFQF